MQAVAEADEFFAPANTDLIDTLVGQYKQVRRKVEAVDQFLRGDGFESVVHYFIEGNREQLTGLRWVPTTEKLFKLEPAIAALNATYWDMALKRTDVLDFMPAKRRDDWFESINKMETPDFDEETVRATLGDLLGRRYRFLAEKVDGIFQALSRTHVTNQPEGFGKRMILRGVIGQFGFSEYRQTGHINDLRQIIAKFQSRDEPGHNASGRLVEIAQREFRGEWLPVDGGAFRIRCYLNGNAHLEVHPDIAWRLNQILAHLYPAAIPSQHRTKPKRQPKDFKLFDRPLPFAVIAILNDMKEVRHTPWPIGGKYSTNIQQPVTTNPNSLRFDYADKDKHAMAEARSVLQMLGGVERSSDQEDWWEFDYRIKDVLGEVIVSGMIPDQKSHQFYPTPASMAARAVELTEIGDNHQCLEPSAGTGNLAALMPKGRTDCVEISKLHCAILEAKGHSVYECDFIEWAGEQDALLGSYDRVVMNPPFDQGRWQAHVEAAATMVSSNGRLVAILPSGASKRLDLPGFAMQWHGPYDNQFAGASVSVVILVADKTVR